MFQVREDSLCESGTADTVCAKAELRALKPKLLCGSGTAERQVAVYFLRGSGTTEFPSTFLVRKGISDLKVTQYSMCGSGTARLEVAVHSYGGGGTAVPRNLDKEYSLCGSRTAEFKVTAYSLYGSGTVELQVTENSVCGSRNASHRIFYVWNMQWSERQGSAGPLVQSHLGGAVIYWWWHLLGFVFVFSVIIKQ